MSTNKRSNRVLAVILTLAMVFGMIPTLAFAAETSGKVEHQGELVTREDDHVQIMKTATKIGENTFQIDLSVWTKDKVEKYIESIAAHVVLVMDTSGSMGASYNNFLPDAKTAAHAFIEAMLGEGSATGNKIAIVDFDQTARTVHTFSNDITSLKSGINSLQASGGTNIQAGLQRAKALIDADKSDAQKFIVLLSDGEPTYHMEVTAVTSGTTGINTIPMPNISGDSDYNGGYYSFYATAFGSTVKGDGSNWKVTGNGRYYVNWASGNSNRHRVVDNILPTLSQAKLIKDAGIEIYSILLGSGAGAAAEHTLQNVASGGSGTKYYVARANTTNLAEDFKNFAREIITSMKAWQVHDPMGTNIDFLAWGTSGTPERPAFITWDGSDESFTWNLLHSNSPAPTNDNGMWKYTYSYRVTLDTSVEGFDSEFHYPTNDVTTLRYYVGDSVQEVTFDVPTVSGTIPNTTYKVEYYVDVNGDGDYTDDGESYLPAEVTAKLHTTVGISTAATSDIIIPHAIADIPSNVRTMMGIPANYNFAGANPARITMVLDPTANVIKLYYVPKLATVVVNHWLVTATTDLNGTTETLADTAFDIDTFENQVVGSTFVATAADEYPLYNGLDSLYANDFDIKVVDGENVINLYYITTVNNLPQVPYQIIHNYKSTTWTFNGETKQWGSVVTNNAENEFNSASLPTQQHGTVITATPNTKSDAFTFIESDPASGSITLTDGATNVINMYYEQENAPTAGQFTVNHSYTTYTKTVVGGVVTTTSATVVVPVVYTGGVYLDETYNITEAEYAQYSNDGNTFALTAGQVTVFENGDSITITSTPDDNNATIFYERTDMSGLTPVTATVTHNYQTYKWELTIVGEDEVFTLVPDGEPTTNKVTLDGPLYLGQEISLTALPNGYNKGLNPDLGEDNGNVYTHRLAASSNDFNLYYHSGPAEDPDNGSVTVYHIYIENRTYIKNGVKVIEPFIEYTSDPDTRTGMVGESFTIAPIPEWDGNDYMQTSPVGVIKAEIKGATGIVEVVYERSTTDLTSATISVRPYYVTKYNRWVDGSLVVQYDINAATAGTVREFPEGEDELYVGMFFSAIPTDAEYQSAGFSFDSALTAADTYQNIVVNDNDEQLIKLYYSKTVDDFGDPVNVIVNHYYEYYAWDAANGVYVKSDFNDTKTEQKLVGQFFTPTEQSTFDTEVPEFGANGVVTFDSDSANAAKVGEAGKIVVTADGYEVDLYYNFYEQRPEKVAYTVTHVYTLIDWDGTEYSTDFLSFKGVGYLDQVITPTVLALRGAVAFTLVDQTYNVNLANGSMTLQDGANDYVLYYEKYVDFRIGSKITVVHNYENEFPHSVGSEVDVFIGKNQGVWIGGDFSATLIPEYNSLVYGFVDATVYASEYDAEKGINGIPLSEITGTGKLDDVTIATPRFPRFYTQVIVINYYREADAVDYTIRHEYFANNAAEGTPVVETKSGKLGSTINTGEIERKLTNGGNTYIFTSVNPEDGLVITATIVDNVITLRYDRTYSWEPDGPTPTTPTPTPTDDDDDNGGGGTGGGGTELVDLEDEDVARSDFGSSEVEEEELEEEEVPRGAFLPKTGSILMTGLLIAGAALTGSGLFLGRKRKEEEEETDTE